MADPRAKEVLATLKPRRSLGDRIMARVGFRAWERPRVAVSDRIFKLYRLQDPFDPSSPLDENTVGLGPVSLRLGEKRREPAPHAKPKEEKKAALPKVPAPTGPAASAPAPRAPAPPSQPRPPESGQQGLGYIPKQYSSKNPAPPPAKPASPPPAPPRPQPPAAKPPAGQSRPPTSGQPMRPQAPRPAEAKQPISYIPKQYGAKGQTSASGSAQPPRATSTPGLFGPKAERPGLVGKLPVRPGLEAPAEPKAPSPAAVKQVAIPAAAPTRAASAAAPSAPKGTLTRSGRLSLGATTVVTSEPGSEEPEVIEVVRVTAPRPAPAPATPVSAAPAPVTPAPMAPPARAAPAAPSAPTPPPVAAEPVRAAPMEPPPPPAPKPPPAPVRTPPRPSLPGQKGGDSLDDFFAASAQEGRMRIGKAKAVTGVSAAEEPEKPKRAPVALPKAVLPTDVPKPKPDEG